MITTPDTVPVILQVKQPNEWKMNEMNENLHKNVKIFKIN